MESDHVSNTNTIEELLASGTEVLSELALEVPRHVGHIAARGATAEEVDSVQDVAERLEHIAAMATSAALTIRSAEIPLVADESIIDPEEVIGIAKRFMRIGCNGMFTYRDLRSHLQKNGITVPHTSQDFRRYAEELIEDVVDELMENGENVRVVQLKKGSQNAIAIAAVVKPVPPSQPQTTLEHVDDKISDVDCPSAEAEPVQPDVVNPPEDQNSFTDDAVLTHLEQSGSVSRYELAKVVAKNTGIEPRLIRSRLKDLRSDGSLKYVRIGGVSHYAVATEDLPDRNLQPTAETTEFDNVKAIGLLEFFRQPKTHANQWFTAKQIETVIIANELLPKGVTINETDVSSLARQLCSLGLLRAGTKGQNKGGHRSSRREVLKFSIISKELFDQLRKGESPAGILERAVNTIEQ